jgi:putative ABC transport system permease protein
VLAEAAVVGTVAAIAGYAGGVGVAEVLNNSFSVTGNQSAALQLFSPASLLAALTLLSAYVPALRASAVSPMAALRTSEPPKAAPLRRRNAIGLGVTALGALLAAAAVGEQNLLFAAAPVLLLGLIILTPLLSLGLTAVIRPAMSRWAGIRGTLAVENARRNPRRTAATAATLMIGLTVVTAATVVIASVNRMDERSAADSMTSDLRISAVDFAQLPDGLDTRVARIPGVKDVSPVTRTAFQLSGRRTLPVTGVRPGAVEDLVPLSVREGSLRHLDHGIAVTRKSAARYGWKLGSRVSGTFTGAAKRTALPVVAIYDGPDSYTPALVSAAGLPPATGGQENPQVESVLVDARAGHVAALKERIRHALDNPVLRIEDRDGARAAASASSALFLNIVYAMLSVSVLIGALGVVNTMGMAVSERVREIGLLRALGLDRRHLASVLRLESMTIALLGSALGVVAGGALGVAAVLSQKGVPLAILWDRVILCFAAAAAIGVLASVWPGRQAARIPLLKAIGTDTE